MKKPFKFGHLQAIVLLFIAAVATWRVLSVPDGDDVSAMANFTPIGAMALFGGAYFSRVNSFIFPLKIKPLANETI